MIVWDAFRKQRTFSKPWSRDEMRQSAQAEDIPRLILETHGLKPSIRSKYQDGKSKFFAGAAIRST
jgi:hypothetical protein